jgi:F0F1-type ATP synthase assembly protein I
MAAMRGDREAWAKVGRVSGFGLTVGIATLLCGWLGMWLDARLGTTPLFTIVLFLGGGGSALYYGILSVLK